MRDLERDTKMFETRLAVQSDVEQISALLLANSAERGGQLMGRWDPRVIERPISGGQPIIIASEGSDCLAFSSLRKRASYTSRPLALC
jgi:hypothetical protein